MLQRLNDGNASIIMPGIPPATSDRLPRPTPVCYKRYMRKWMSERLKRRKTRGHSPAKDGTKAPEPLQPRFYDDEPAAAPEVIAAPVTETRRPPKVEQVQAPVLESPPEPASAGESSAVQAESSSEVQVRPRISRRRRGGRGGSRSKPASPSSVVADEAAAKDVSAAETPEADLLPGESRSGRSKSLQGSRAPSAQHPSAQHQSPQRPSPQRQAAASATQSAAASAALPTQSAAAPRPSKGTVVLAIGFPGAGERSWFKRH